MNNQQRSPWLRWILALLVTALLVPSCVPGFSAPSKVLSLRILAVTIDKPYANPGDDVTLRMTVTDGLGNREGPDSTLPRDLQLLWIGGCTNPEGDQYYLCIEQLAERLAPLADGVVPTDGVVKLATPSASEDGEVDAHEFTFTVADDIISSRPKPAAGPHYGIEYVFFAACAGTLRPAALQSTGGEVPDFPLACVGPDGEELGSDSFVIGYTQIYVFADGRTNENAANQGITLNGREMATNPDDAETVRACSVPFDERRTASCGGSTELDDCNKYVIRVTVEEDVAETDPDATDPDGKPLDEVVWVNYFTEGGDVSPSLALINDATKGFQKAHETEWTPPDIPGLYRLWAVVRDQRGGSSVVRGWVRVE